MFSLSSLALDRKKGFSGMEYAQKMVPLPTGAFLFCNCILSLADLPLLGSFPLSLVYNQNWRTGPSLLAGSLLFNCLMPMSK